MNGHNLVLMPWKVLNKNDEAKYRKMLRVGRTLSNASAAMRMLLLFSKSTVILNCGTESHSVVEGLPEIVPQVTFAPSVQGAFLKHQRTCSDICSDAHSLCWPYGTLITV